MIECSDFEMPARSKIPLGVYEMLCQISFNEQDFGASGHNSENAATIFHAFEPLAIAPNACSVAYLQTVHQTAEEEEMHQDELGHEQINLHKFDRKFTLTAKCVIPTSYLPKGTHIKAFPSHAIVYRSKSDAANSLMVQEIPAGGLDEILLYPNTSDSFTFTMSYNYLKNLDKWLSEADLGPQKYVIALHFRVFLELAQSNQLTPLSEATIPLYLYSDTKSEVSITALSRRASSGAMIITQENLFFEPNCAVAKVHFNDCSLPIQSYTFNPRDMFISEALGSLDVALESNESADVPSLPLPYSIYKVELLMPSYEELQSHARRHVLSEDGKNIMESMDIPDIKYVSVSLSLDGSTDQPVDCWSKIYFSGYLAQHYSFQPPLAKGGAVAGSSQGVLLDHYFPVLQNGAHIRLRGANADTAVIVPAAMSATHGSSGSPACLLSFTMPDTTGIAGNPPVINGKEKLYYVDISIDGGESFDEAPSPLLQIK